MQPEARLCTSLPSFLARRWTKLELVCCISRQRLTDPAKGAGCTHLPMCNFAQLSAYSAQSKQCPVLGCAASLSRRHAVVRDEKLRAALQAVSPSQEAVWVRGDELCLDAPDVSEAAFSAPAPPAPAAKRPQHLPRSSAEVVMKREVEIDDCRNMGSGLSGKRAMTSDQRIRAHIVEPAAKKQALHPQEEQEQEEDKGMCGTPGCTLPDFHFGPCTSWDGLCGARKRRKPSRLADWAFELYTAMDELGARKQPPNPCNKTEVRVRTEPPTATPARYCKAPTDPAPAAEVEVSHLAVSEVDETPGTGRSRLLELACYFEIKDDQIEPHVTVDCRDTARPLPGRQLPSRISHGPRRRRPQARQHQQQVVEQPDVPSPAPIPPLGAAKYYAEDTVKVGADGRSKWRVEVLAGPGATWVPENGAVHSLSQSTTPQSMQKAVGGAPPASAPPAAAAPKVWAEGTIAPLPAPTEAMHTAVTAGSSQATSESLKQTLGRVDGAQAADVVVARRRAPFAREKDASDYAFQAYLAQHPNDFPDESVEGVEAGMACAHCGRWCGNAGALTRHLTACTAKLAANDAQSQDLYAVERILGERRRHGKVEYLLSWLGFGASHNSWEPEENVLDHSVVEQWRTRRCGAVAEPRRQQEQATRAEAVVKEAQHTSDVPAASAAHPKKTGDESVSTNKRRFLAFARRDDKETFLGSFTTPEEAALLRVRTPWRGLKHFPQRGAPMVKMLVPDSVTAGERFTVRNPDDGRGHEVPPPS